MLLWLCATLVPLFIAAKALRNYFELSWRFRVESHDNIEVVGIKDISKAEIMEIMGENVDRNIFHISLSQQKARLEEIPEVQSACVMRILPNRLRVEIHERIPVAFVRAGTHISLIDESGRFMRLEGHKFSFPLISGVGPDESLPSRAIRMRAYTRLINDLDSDGFHYSKDLSEIDLSDLDHIRVLVDTQSGPFYVDLGSSDYRRRYVIFLHSHLKQIQ